MRQIRHYETYFLNASHNVQMAIQLADPKYVPIFIEKLIKSCSGFHLKTDMKNLIYNGNNVEITALPHSISSTNDAVNWAVDYNSPHFDQSLATISANDSIIVINSNHLCCDGGFLKYILSHFNQDSQAAMFPRMIDDIFGEQMKRSPPASTHFENSDTLSRIPWEDNKRENPELNETTWTKQIYLIHPASHLKCFNKDTQKMHGLTESLWTGLSLTLSAMGNTFNGTVGSNTCVNLRQLLDQNSIDLSISNGYTRMNILAHNTKLNEKLSSVYRKLRKDFETKKENGSFFTALKLNMNGFPSDPNPGSFGQVTNIGPLKIVYPISDFSIRQSVFCRAAERCFSLLSYSKIDKSRNDVILNLRYAPTVTSLSTASKVAKSVEFFLTQIDENTSVGDALTQLKDFQNNT
ncbi:hypothetical protein TRFO_43267 [Tritrichomonas foetus]|uniref:Condensation domain-containing protein n=1 Tax=Tritrichomonas foetus TaxID=1144522 RepID=A0A1J4KR72_9EUKA|nr:hypothetical protein TRFO_43267 [Tritrichomonas foetus]|eukprot:OHT13759.1 hypothetical protein TRFO_43267 [Tritrichomonas foetus]